MKMNYFLLNCSRNDSCMFIIVKGELKTIYCINYIVCLRSNASMRIYICGSANLNQPIWIQGVQ